MAGSRPRISRANRNFDDARAARLYRLRASGLQPGDPLPGAQQPQSAPPSAEPLSDEAHVTGGTTVSDISFTVSLVPARPRNRT